MTPVRPAARRQALRPAGAPRRFLAVIAPEPPWTRRATAFPALSDQGATVTRRRANLRVSEPWATVRVTVS